MLDSPLSCVYNRINRRPFSQRPNAQRRSFGPLRSTQTTCTEDSSNNRSAFQLSHDVNPTNSTTSRSTHCSVPRPLHSHSLCLIYCRSSPSFLSRPCNPFPLLAVGKIQTNDPLLHQLFPFAEKIILGKTSFATVDPGRDDPKAQGNVIAVIQMSTIRRHERVEESESMRC